jgi:Fe2+ transport system protein FeoA
MKVSFQNLKKNVPATIKDCVCEKRFLELGILPGREIEIVSECPFGGTVVIKTEFGSLCVRRNELNLDLETKEGNK